MRYIGSKTSCLPLIAEAIKSTGVTFRSLCDPFAGICTVSRYFKGLGVRVMTGDILALSHMFQMAYLLLNRAPTFAGVRHVVGDLATSEGMPAHLAVIKYLNALPRTTGFVTRQYSPQGSHGRLFFTVANAGRIDTIRSQIQMWRRDGLISEEGNAYLLTSLVEAADRVANTAGTYYAYLKGFYRKALKPLEMRTLPIASNGLQNRIARADAATLVGQVEADVLYLDPPYNEREYGSYYHLPETLVLWDKPEVRGKSGMRVDCTTASAFCRKESAGDALASTVKRAQAKCILLHYAVDGLIAHRTILKVLRSRGSTTWRDWEVRKYSSARRDGSKQTCCHRLYLCLED